MPDTQYFTNIDGKYVKDAEARQQLNDLEDYVESLDQPWQPLEDGYSNFWFELTNDTLSPWLNFSAKTENAVIDWGDGSGEVSLDTLTPTHTYSKGGRYVVKVKGMTGIGRQHSAPFDGNYFSVLKSIEFNSEVTSSLTYAFSNALGLRNAYIANSTVISEYFFNSCTSLQNVQLPSTLNDIPTSVFYGNRSLKHFVFPQSVSSVGISAFNTCLALTNLTFPSTIVSIGTYSFNNCLSLSEIHVRATTPPTLGKDAFYGLPSNWLCYVPVGYGDTYKSAAGWSAYADHILEEGQTPNRIMLAKFKEETDELQDDMR